MKLRSKSGIKAGSKLCSPVKCERCGKVTWSGCGQHIEEALEGFSDDQLCKCPA